MLETVQGRDMSGVLLHEGIRVTILEKDESYIIDDTFGYWLIENGKAEVIAESAKKHSKKAEVPEQPKQPEQPVMKRGRHEKNTN